MTDPAFSQSALGWEPLLTAGGGATAPVTPPIDAILAAGQYLRVKQLATTEAQPLYGDPTTDYAVPTVAPNITKWYVENGGLPWTPADAAYESLGSSLFQSTNRIMRASNGFDLDNSNDASYLYVGDFQNDVTFGFAGLMQGNGVQVSLGSTGEFLFSFARSTGGFEQIQTAAQTLTTGTTYAVLIEKEPTEARLYLNNVLIASLPHAGIYVAAASASTINGSSLRPKFFGQWLGANRPSRADIQSILVPAIA